MRAWLVTTFGTLLLCALWQAQTSSAPGTSTPQNQTSSMAQNQNGSPTAPATAPSQTASAPEIAPGSVIPVQLTKSIDAKKAKTGDPVEAKVTQDLKAGNSELVIPKDTKIVGHVTEAQSRNKEDKESQLGIGFDHAVIKNGSDGQLPMSIQAVIAPSRPNTDTGGYSPQMPSPSTGGAPPGGRPAEMGGGATAPTPPPTAGGFVPSSTEHPGTNSHADVTGNTQGGRGIFKFEALSGIR